MGNPTPSLATDQLAAKLLAMVERSFNDVVELGPSHRLSKRQKREAFRAMVDGIDVGSRRARASINSLVRTAYRKSGYTPDPSTAAKAPCGCSHCRQADTRSSLRRSGAVSLRDLAPLSSSSASRRSGEQSPIPPVSRLAEDETHAAGRSAPASAADPSSSRLSGLPVPSVDQTLAALIARHRAHANTLHLSDEDEDESEGDDDDGGGGGGQGPYNWRSVVRASPLVQSGDEDHEDDDEDDDDSWTVMFRDRTPPASSSMGDGDDGGWISVGGPLAASRERSSLADYMRGHQPLHAAPLPTSGPPPTEAGSSAAGGGAAVAPFPSWVQQRLPPNPLFRLLNRPSSPDASLADLRERSRDAERAEARRLLEQDVWASTDDDLRRRAPVARRTSYTLQRSPSLSSRGTNAEIGLTLGAEPSG